MEVRVHSYLRLKKLVYSKPELKVISSTLMASAFIYLLFKWFLFIFEEESTSRGGQRERDRGSK